MSADLECPECHERSTHVIDTRDGRMLGQSIRRRRECLHCGFRFTTHEVALAQRSAQDERWLRRRRKVAA